MRARVRAEVFAALDDPGEPRPAAPRETLLLNELIREYLQFHRHNASASVFLAGEAASPAGQMEARGVGGPGGRPPDPRRRLGRLR